MTDRRATRARLLLRIRRGEEAAARGAFERARGDVERLRADAAEIDRLRGAQEAALRRFVLAGDGAGAAACAAAMGELGGRAAQVRAAIARCEAPLRERREALLAATTRRKAAEGLCRRLAAAKVRREARLESVAAGDVHAAVRSAGERS